MFLKLINCVESVENRIGTVIHTKARVYLKSILRQSLESKGGRSDSLFTEIIYGNICRHPANVPDLNVADFTVSPLPISFSSKPVELAFAGTHLMAR